VLPGLSPRGRLSIEPFFLQPTGTEAFTSSLPAALRTGSLTTDKQFNVSLGVAENALRTAIGPALYRVS
jgi:hypothetical protein